MMTKLRLAVLGVLASAMTLSGCLFPCVATVPDQSDPPEVAVFGPPVYVGVMHDARRHHGRPSRWHAGRRIYFVDGRWEYREGSGLYTFQTIRSRPVGVVPARTVIRNRPDGRVRENRGGHVPSRHGHSRDDDDDDNDRRRRRGGKGSVRENNDGDSSIPRVRPSPQ